MNLKIRKIIDSVPIFLSIFVYRVGNCVEISYDDIRHYDIIVSSSKEVKETWLDANQVSLLPNTNSHNLSLSTQLQMMSRDTALRNYGHVLFLRFPIRQSEMIFELVNIGKFHHYHKKVWKPHFFLKVPLEYENPSISSYPNLIANLSLNLPINSDVYLTFASNLSSNKENSTGEVMIEIYSIKNHTIIQDTKNQIKTKMDGSINYNSVLQKSPRRSNFQGISVTAVSMDVHGYELATDFDDDNSTQTRFAGGFEVETYWFLRDAANFSELAIKGTGFVREGHGGTLTGMAFQINKGDADICISSTEFLEYRVSGSDGVSYLHPTFEAGMLAFFKQPPASSIRDVFISSFSLDLWFMLLGLWMVIVVAMNLAYRIYLKSSDEIDSKDLKMSEEISVWAAGAICQQGWYFTPQAIWARIIFFFGWFTGSLCYTAFSASLVSILAVEVLAIHSFADLLREKFYIYNDGHIPTTKYYVKGLEERGQIPVVPEALRNVDIEDTIAKLPKSRSTMITLSDSFYPIIRKAGYSDDFACNVLSVVGLGSRPVMMSMFVKRGSPLREIFNNKLQIADFVLMIGPKSYRALQNYIIILMTERGVKHRLMKIYLIETSVQCLKGSSGFHAPLSSKDVFTAYVILLVGLGLALTLAFVEKIFKKLWSRRSDNNNEVDLNMEMDLSYFEKKRQSSLAKLNDLKMGQF